MRASLTRANDQAGSGASRRRGLTLVEILLAGFILTVVMIPITQLIFGGTTRTQVGRDKANAVALATDVMGQLLEKVPYSAIDPEGASIELQADIWSDVEKKGGGPAAGRNQAKLADEWAKVLDDDGDDGNGRIIKRSGTRFEVVLYAGTFKDDEGSRDASSGFNNPGDANFLKKELTFSYFRNPYVPVDADSRQQVTLDSGADSSLIPYETTPGALPGGVRSEDVHDPRYRAAWPQGASDVDGDGYQDVTMADFNGKSPSQDWPRHTLDQSDFREDEAFMKLVLGVRWKSAGAGFQGSGMSKTSKEFWLVSFKAKLEE